MQVLKLLNDFSLPDNLLPFQELGYGSDGQVFSLKKDLNKVIKYSIIFSYPGSDIQDKFHNFKKIIEYIILNKPKAYSTVYDFGFLCSSKRKTFDGFQDYIIHFHIMEKLQKISDDEKKAMFTLISHEDKNIVKNYSDIEIKKILKGLKVGLDIDEEKIILFCEQIKSCALNHNDLHPRNIMKDNLGNFKLIDFDKCSFKE